MVGHNILPIAEKSLDILLAEDFLILVGLEEPEPSPISHMPLPACDRPALA